MRTLAFFATVAALCAQTKFTNVQIIPTPPDATGSLSWLEKRANGIHKFTWTAPDALAADVAIKWPTDGAAGFLYHDGSGNTNWTGAGTCGVDCMTLTTNQTAAGIKTFTNGLILQGTSTTRQLNPEADDTYSLGTSVLRFQNIYGSDLISIGSSGGTETTHAPGVTSYYNSAAVQRILLSQGAGASTVSGIIRTFNATDTINSIDGVLGMFSAVGFQVGTYASPIPIIDAAGLVTPVSFQLSTGAVNGYCLVSDATGVGTWQACSAGGSFVTTNTAQTGLTGTKEWNSNHTYNAHILTGTASTYDLGTNASAWRVGYVDTASVEHVEINDSARSAFWRLSYGSAANSIILDSGSGAQRELTVQVFSATDTKWTMRGSLFPAIIGGDNGDIGASGNKWRAGYFSGTLVADTFDGVNVTLTSAGTINFATGRNLITQTAYQGYDATLANVKVLVSWASTSGGIVRTYSNAGVFQNSIDESGILTNIGYAVGPFGGGTTIINNSGKVTPVTFQLATGASAGYVLTSDASGNATWQAPGGGSFVTTNTNQTSLSGTKQWTSAHTFVGGVAVQLTSTARNWMPETDDAYDFGDATTRWRNVYSSDLLSVGNNGGQRTEHTFGISTYYNGSNVQRVLVSQGGGASTVSGIIRTYNATDTIHSIDGTLGVFSAVGFHVGTYASPISVIDSTGAATFKNTLPITDLLYSLGSVSRRWSTVWATTQQLMGGGLYIQNSAGSTAYINMDQTGADFQNGATVKISGTNAIDSSRNGSFVNLTISGTCTGCPGAITNYVTTNTTQTGLSGDKSWTGTHIWGTASSTRTEITTSGSTSWYNSSNVQRVLISNGAGSSSTSGIVRTFNSTTNTNGMDSTGIYTTIGFTANGVAGASGTINVRNSAGTGSCTITVTMGLVTSSTC